MRCQACNKVLNDSEAIRKDPRTGDFIDMCNKCYGSAYEALAELEGTFEWDAGMDSDEIMVDYD